MKTTHFFVLLFAGFALHINSQVVGTLAGSGVAGGNDATGTAATFNSPSGICTDASGNVFVADLNNNKIRKVTPSGVVTTFAGSGTAGGTDATGTAASFTNPMYICSDASDNLYVTEYYNNRIRKITPAGVVTTFAGSGTAGALDGTGTAATFYHPRGICADISGNIYVADAGNSKIRKISPSGVVSTLASGLNIASGICIDASGNLFVTCNLNNIIQKVTASGVVSTFAGSGASGNASGTGTAATFNSPVSICINASGDFYITESAGYIRKMTSSAVVSTYAGTGSVGSTDGPLLSASFNHPQSISIDNVGNMYIADINNNKLRFVANCSSPAAPINTTSSTNQAICSGLQTILSATSTGTVNWYSTSTSTTVLGSGTSFTTSALSTGTYTYYAEASTCTVSVTRTAITVTVNALPVISVNSGSICSGNSFTLNPTGGATYTISGGSTVVSPTSSASYSVTGTSAQGCVSSNTAVSSVIVNALPNIVASSSNTLLCVGQTASLTATGAQSYLWNTSETNSTIVVSPVVNTSYTVTGTDVNGCSNSTVLTQSVSSCTGVNNLLKQSHVKLYPNPTDGAFWVTGLEENTQVSIYNAIGVLIDKVQTTDTDASFDLTGYQNGMYFLKFKNSGGEFVVKLVKQH